MQILFIPKEAQVVKFLAGLQAEAMMPETSMEISALSEESEVTVICSGGSSHYQGWITKIERSYEPVSADGKWLNVKFLVRRKNSFINYDSDLAVLND
jgi:hypothetical protein